MTNVFVEAVPKGRPEGTMIFHFVLEHADGSHVTSRTHSMRQGAINEAWGLGHDPLLARMRNADKTKPEDWCAASRVSHNSRLIDQSNKDE